MRARSGEKIIDGGVVGDHRDGGVFQADLARAIPLDKIGAVLEEAMGRVRRIIGVLCEK
jgi:hypothetical protein